MWRRLVAAAGGRAAAAAARSCVRRAVSARAAELASFLCNCRSERAGCTAASCAVALAHRQDSLDFRKRTRASCELRHQLALKGSRAPVALAKVRAPPTQRAAARRGSAACASSPGRLLRRRLMARPAHQAGRPLVTRPTGLGRPDWAGSAPSVRTRRFRPLPAPRWPKRDRAETKAEQSLQNRHNSSDASWTVREAAAQLLHQSVRICAGSLSPSDHFRCRRSTGPAQPNGRTTQFPRMQPVVAIAVAVAGPRSDAFAQVERRALRAGIRCPSSGGSWEAAAPAPADAARHATMAGRT